MKKAAPLAFSEGPESFAYNLYQYAYSDKDRSRKAVRLRTILEDTNEKRFRRRMKRLEGHARAQLDLDPTEKIDWSKIDWAALFEKLLKLLLIVLPFLI